MPGVRRRMPAAARLALVALLAAGCGGGGDDKKAATQVAARVNAEEITVHQVNNVLARARNVSAEDAPRAKRAILDRLIDQELAKQQAIEKELDRSPAVVQAIEAAKNEILARAYLQQVAAARAKPTPDEVKKYYAEHPELFAERRLYVIEEIAVQRGEGVETALRERVAKARSMQEVAEWLKERDVRYAANRGARAAEQLPLQMLPTLNAMKDGEIQVVEVGERLNVIRVVATKPAPVDETAAAPRIEQFLQNRRSAEIVAEEMKRLKAQAKIEYAGEFAELAKSDAPPLEVDTGEQEKDASPAESAIERGVRGLK